MIRILVLALGLVASGPAFGDIEDPCADLWFSRNAMLDKAGYCFSSLLGKAVFDNSDCTNKQPNLTPAIKAQIAFIQKLEQDEACEIDTSRRTLDLPKQELRKRLDFQPATDGGVSVCIGYLGNDTPLYSAPSNGARKLGEITKGDTLSLAHLDWKDWVFSMLWRDNETVALGWHQVDSGHSPLDICADWAG